MGETFESTSQELERTLGLKPALDISIRTMVGAGIPSGKIRATQVDVHNISEAVSQFSSEDDVVVLSETSASERDSFFNTLHEDIEEAISCPVLLILKEDEEDNDG